MFDTCMCGDLAIAHDGGHCSKCACPAFVASYVLGDCEYLASCGCVCDFERGHAGMHRCEHIGPHAYGEDASHGAAYVDWLAAQLAGDFDNGD